MGGVCYNVGVIIYFGADHRGFNLKEYLKELVKEQAFEVVDMGNKVYDEKDDYPDFAAAVVKKVSADPEGSKGILMCGSGTGMDIAANKFSRVRSVLALSGDQVYDARHDDDVNVLTFAADFVSNEDAAKITKVFLETPFSGEERHRRRLEKISDIENRAYSS